VAPKPEQPVDEVEAIVRAFADVVDDARSQIGAGRSPSRAVAEARIRALAEPARARGGARAAAVAKAEAQALAQLGRVFAIHRARALLTSKGTEPAPRARAAAVRTRPTITANMSVHREGDADRPRLRWDPATAVAGWEVRFSERPDARAAYELRETLTLEPGATAVDVPLGGVPLRVNILGRRRDGRLLRRALISGLTRETWGSRWEQRASAS
jgi:hypothetical protein